MFICVADYNPNGNVAHDAYVLNYYGEHGDDYNWEENTVWKSDETTWSTSYKSNRANRRHHQHCAAWRIISED